MCPTNVGVGIAIEATAVVSGVIGVENVHLARIVDRVVSVVDPLGMCEGSIVESR